MVKGRVQGVGFRYFTQEQAMSCGLNGWVKNLYDGSVELEAEGEEKILEQFTRRVKEGPAYGHVSELTVNHVPVNNEKDGFNITY